MKIDVSLDVYKALTVRLTHDGHTYDDVLRGMLDLDSPTEPQVSEGRIEAIANRLTPEFNSGDVFVSRDLRLPSGTKLRARYKGNDHKAAIVGDKWVGSNQVAFSSPSAAANAITGNNVNGLRFWEALLPGDSIWRRLEGLAS